MYMQAAEIRKKDALLNQANQKNSCARKIQRDTARKVENEIINCTIHTVKKRA